VTWLADVTGYPQRRGLHVSAETQCHPLVGHPGVSAETRAAGFD
jgi:hypothetical protein